MAILSECVWTILGVITLDWNSTLIVTSLLLLWYLWTYFHDDYKNLPPGPQYLSVLGYLLFLKEAHVTYRDLSTVYGPIVNVKLGTKRVVVLNDLKTIKEGLNNRNVLFRPDFFFLAKLDIHGVVSLNGEAWSDNRRFCLHVLRDLGFGKSSVEEHMREECLYLTKILASHAGSPIFVEEYLAPSVSNNVASLLMGQRFDFDHPRRRFLDRCLSILLNNATFFNVIDFFFLLRALVQCVSFFRAGKVRRIAYDLKEYFRGVVEERKQTNNWNEDRDFIDRYLKQIVHSEQDGNYTMEYLVGNVINFFGAGGNTVRTSILWNLLVCARYPKEVQKKIQQEIQEVIGKERLPAWEDRLQMPFTMAVLWEMQRWRTIAPLSIVRGTTADTEIAGYTVPANTAVIANLWAVHMDPNVWDKPEDFNPYRHLSKDGSQLLPKPEHIISFSTGKRMCPAETFATMEVFLYLTAILQKFTVLPPDGLQISMKPCTRLVTVPAAKQALRFLPR